MPTTTTNTASPPPPLPPWAAPPSDPDLVPDERQTLVERAEHGTRRLRARQGAVPAWSGHGTDLGPHWRRAPGICFLAWFAGLPDDRASSQYLAARAIGRALQALHERGTPLGDPRIVAGCIAVRDLEWNGRRLPLQADTVDHLAHVIGDALTTGQDAHLAALAELLTTASVPAPPVAAPAPGPTPPPESTRAHDGELATSRWLLPGRQLVARRASAQHLEVGDASALTLPELTRARLAIQQCDRLTRAVAAASLIIGPAAYALDTWQVAATPASVDPTRATLVLQPSGIVLPNQINAALPLRMRANIGCPSAFIPLPLPGYVPGIDEVLAFASTRVGGSLVSKNELNHVRRELRRIREREDIPLSRRQLTSILERTIRRLAADDIFLAFLNGKPLDTRLAPRLHYIRLTLHALQDTWLACMAALQQMLGGADG